MNFKPYFFALAVIAITATISCDKDDPDPLAHLIHTWTLSTVTVENQPGTGTGTLTFYDDLTGNMGLSYAGGGIQITFQGSFTYTATNNEITFSSGSIDSFTWTRTVNSENVQEFEFEENVQGQNYSVRLRFTR